MESSQIFHEKREALIEKKYNADEIQQRILNGDGGSWIRETYDPDAIFQLDRYHIYQEILRKISDRDAQREARKLFEEEKITEFLEFILVYADSVETTDEKTKEVKRQENCITISITTKTDCYRIKSRDGRYQNQEKESYTKIWVCRNLKTARSLP